MDLGQDVCRLVFATHEIMLRVLAPVDQLPLIDTWYPICKLSVPKHRAGKLHSKKWLCKLTVTRALLFDSASCPITCLTMNKSTRAVGSQQLKNRRNSVVVNGVKIKELRKRLGLTQEEFATDIDYSERLVRKAERGGRIDAKTLRVISRYFHQNGLRISIDQLTSGTYAIHSGETILRDWLIQLVNGDDSIAIQSLMSAQFKFFINGQPGSGIRTFHRAIHEVFEGLQPAQFVVDQVVTDGKCAAARWFVKRPDEVSRTTSQRDPIRLVGDVWIRIDDQEISEARWLFRRDHVPAI